jgi:hypothetical protein
MSKYKNSFGIWITKGLFWEKVPPENKEQAAFTLKSEPHEGLPSLYQLYMASDDPTEYDFAVTHLGGWDHWLSMQSMKWFVDDYLTSWRLEKEIRAKSVAFRAIMKEAEEGGKNAFQANKFIVDKMSPKPESSGRGRPSKDAINQAAINIARDTFDMDSDFKRISGVQVN